MSLFFASYVGTRTLTSIFKDNQSLRSHKTVKIKVFSKFFLLVGGKDPDPGEAKRLRIHRTLIRNLIKFMIGPSIHLQRLGQLSGVCPATGVQAGALGPSQRPVSGLQCLHHHQPRHRLL
jgi:hypothetical protein